MKTSLKLTPHIFLGFAILSQAAYAAAPFVADDTQRTGWVAPLEVSKIDFSSGNETIYRPFYNKADWSGNLYAYPVSAAGVVDVANERWGTGTGINAHGGAAAVLNAQAAGNGWDSGRKIVTLNSDGAKIAFRWGPSGTGFGIANNTDPANGTPAASLGNKTTGPKVLNYIRGNRSDELPAGILRARNSLLGDIVHSRPLYDAHDVANPRIYVGANDGMLHAFNATTGAEVFAYIPSMLVPKLKNLTIDTDPYKHFYYVDGSPNARTVTISGTTKTILVGGIGAGGSGPAAADGLYALDISDATTPTTELAAASKILWEITPTKRIHNGTISTTTNYANLGHVYGAPLIVKVNTNSGEWAAIVGNGYNSGNGDTSLLVIRLATGELIQEIVASTSGTASAPGGLSKPAAIDTNGDGTVDRVYAGDIDGNMWKFDLSNTSSGSWGATKVYATGQAITGAPSVALHPLGGYMINFGTGRMFTEGDASATTAYSVYGLRDNETTIVATDIVAQTLTEKSYTSCPTAVNPCRVRISSNNTVNYASKKGWKITLSAGERVVGDGGLINSDGRYVFSTTNPTIAHAKLQDGTLIPHGENWLVEVAYDSGGIGESPFFDMNADGVIDTSDLLPAPASGSESRVPIARLINYGVLSQPIMAQLSTYSKTFFNSNPDVDPPSDVTGGVAGGHFDFDIFYNACTLVGSNYSCSESGKHVHEYDDKYGVTGVNMLDASNSEFNLDANIIPSDTTPFKILIANQKLSPAAAIKIGTDAANDTYTPVYNYLTSASLNMALLPTYTRATLQSLTLNLPLNAFSTRNWATDASACTPPSPFNPNSTCRVGVVPGKTGCVQDNANGAKIGYPWMDGALTIQIVSASTTDADVELNIQKDPSMGYRLKTTPTALTKQLAQYTMFWHVSNVCYGSLAYVPNPAIDPDSGTSDPSGTGSDPTGGFNSGNNNPGGTNSEVIRDTNYVDGTYVTLTVTRNDTGPSTTTTSTSTASGTTTSSTPGGGSSGGEGGKEHDKRLTTGRISWREVVRP